MRNPENTPGYLDAKRRTMTNIAARAVPFIDDYASELEPTDTLRDPVVAIAALYTPSREWHAAMGLVRPKPWRIRRYITFLWAIHRAKREIRANLDRILANDARRAHRR